MINNISKITLGTAQLGLNYGIANKRGKPDEADAFDILSKALGNSITCFDTARAYGDSETVIGSYFKSHKHKRENVCIVTKFKLGDIDKSEASAKIFESIDTSLGNLNMEYVDILLMHDAKEYIKYSCEIEKAVSLLLSNGKIRKFGASAYGLHEIYNLMDHELFHAFQLPFNLLDQRFMEYDTDKLGKKLIFARSIYLQGLFFMKPEELKGNLTEASPYIKKINELANEFDMSISKLSMMYVKSLGFIDSIVIGADNSQQVIENSTLVSSDSLKKDLVKYIEKKLEGAPEWIFTPWLWDKQT